MIKTIMLLIALLFVLSCAGMQQENAPAVPEAQPTVPVVQGKNYSGKWTGQSIIEGQGIMDNLDLTLVHQNGTVTGVMSDSQGFVSNASLMDVELNEKTLKFSFMATTPMGSMPVKSVGTFSEDSKEMSLAFVVPDLNMTGNGKLIRSEN